MQVQISIITELPVERLQIHVRQWLGHLVARDLRPLGIILVKDVQGRARRSKVRLVDGGGPRDVRQVRRRQDVERIPSARVRLLTYGRFLDAVR